MEAKHTPGPWRLSRTQRYVMDGVAAPWVCEVTERPGWEANARLIAASPSLLEALKEAQSVLAMMVEPGAIEQTTVINAYAAAKAAEAKARTAISQAEGGE